MVGKLTLAINDNWRRARGSLRTTSGIARELRWKLRFFLTSTWTSLLLL